MDLKGIISISGKAGLYTIAGQSKSSVIVESMIDGKKFPAFASNRISALEDISIYTMEGDAPLGDVYRSLYNSLDGAEAPNHKLDMSELRAKMLEILPDYDDERVYDSDIRKLFQWYNLLHKSDKLKLKDDNAEEAKEEASEEAATEE